MRECLRMRAIVVLFGMVAAAVASQAQPQAELAARMSGRWLLSKGGGPALVPAAYLTQRGAGGGIAPEPPPQMPNLTAVEAAAQAALSVVHQLPPEMTIEATITSIRFTEPRGESTFQIDGKNAIVSVPGGTIKVKSKWDRGTLRQEFASTQRVLHRTWSFDALGRLVLTQRMEGIGFRPRESQARYDRQ